MAAVQSETKVSETSAFQRFLRFALRWVFAPVQRPYALFQARMQRWFLSRLPFSDEVQLTQRRVYILPTRVGWMLLVTLLVLLLASINYQLNLGYLLTFMLSGAAVVGMYVCHGNLRGLRLSVAQPEPAFAGSTVVFPVRLVNERRRARYSIALRVQEQERDHQVWADTEGRGSASVEMGFVPAQRGRVRLPVVVAETRYPLGSFRVWGVWRPKAEVLVYPQPEINPPPLPVGRPVDGVSQRTVQKQSVGDYEGVRAYRAGDPLKLVVWKKMAKSDQLVSRDSSTQQRFELWLDYAETAGRDHEHKLSRLCAWVLQADRQGVQYGLQLPAVQIAPGSGHAHRQQCLEALALA